MGCLRPNTFLLIPYSLIIIPSLTGSYSSAWQRNECWVIKTVVLLPVLPFHARQQETKISITSTNYTSMKFTSLLILYCVLTENNIYTHQIQILFLINIRKAPNSNWIFSSMSFQLKSLFEFRERDSTFNCRITYPKLE